ncbi:MAG: hypothetical protein EOP02_01320 [Proteobacteria bacterium]|nr:MAG: hypothetical protein EOP02_01320 [Pseudomonadota bacterium]
MLKANWSRHLLFAGLGKGVAVAPQYIGARHTSAANVALIFAACPVLVALIETVVWKLPLGRMRTCGMLMAIADVLVVMAKGDAAALGKSEFGHGGLWVMLAAGSWVLYRPSPDISSVEVGGHARKRVVIGALAKQQRRTADAKSYR